MATHKIGKLKFNLSGQGLAYRWGEGEIRRFAFGKGGAPEGGASDYPEGDRDPYDDGYYDDRAGDDSDYREDDYDDRGYEKDYDDGYGDGEGEAGEYYRDEESRAPAGAAMEYIENNLWAQIALLIVLPPLGIYLLWRLNRFEPRIRLGVSAAAAVWFIVLLVLLFSGIFGGGQDKPTLPQMTLTTTVPTEVPTTVPTTAPTNELGADAIASPEVSPSATPHAGDTTGTDQAGSSALVYSQHTGLYYHSDQNCSNIPAGVPLTRMTVAAAQNRNQIACPVCIGDQEIFYATDTGKWYHKDKNCQGMTTAKEITKAAAVAAGKTACPVCAGGTAPTNNNSNNSSGGTSKSASQRYFEGIRNDKSGLEVYMTASGKYYHTNPTCSGMSGAKKVSLLAALQAGKPGCPVCSAGSSKRVYCTESGKYYHTVKDCSKMQNAVSVTLDAALVLGKKKCPVCVGESFYTPDDSAESETVYVYATRTGKYYHTNATCSGMTDAEKVTLLQMITAGRPPCPVCASSADKTVYASPGGQYYHSYATCSGMTDAVSGTLARALAMGYTACSKCWGSSAPGDSTNTGNTGGGGSSEDGNTGYSGVYVYATEEGKYYHTTTSCSKAENGVTKVLLEQAIDDGKQPCPTCAATANNTVYAVKGGTYYHKVSNCSGMKDAKSGTLAQALVAGLKQCPVCFATSDGGSSGTSTAKYVSGTSGIDVYATASGKYYHTKSSCSNLSGSPSKVTLETALNYGKSACPVCAESADRTVYATKGGKYYHYSSSCAGSSAAKGTLDVALAYGLKPCPNCVTGSTSDENTSSGRFTSGTSGIKVYAKPTEKYFHTKSNCGGMTGAQYVTLETALNYGLKACPNCAASAAKKVYSVVGSGTYHFDASHAGPGAVSGTLAEALAYGLKPCATCVTGGGDSGTGGSTGGSEEGEDSSAPADTKVYIDLSGDSSAFLYHTSSKCADSGMKNGQGVTLQYALDHGYGDCGYCNPPTSISQ